MWDNQKEKHGEAKAFTQKGDHGLCTAGTDTGRYSGSQVVQGGAMAKRQTILTTLRECECEPLQA